MNSMLKYRVVAFALVVVFAVFNIGIPIIIASCPMAAMMGGSTCGMCNDQDVSGTAGLTTERNTSCCATTIVAERNTNEFVQAKSNMPDVAKVLSVVLTEFTPVFILRSPVSVLQVSSSPPTAVDIPILTSSLLI